MNMVQNGVPYNSWLTFKSYTWNELNPLLRVPDIVYVERQLQ